MVEVDGDTAFERLHDASAETSNATSPVWAGLAGDSAKPSALCVYQSREVAVHRVELERLLTTDECSEVASGEG